MTNYSVKVMFAACAGMIAGGMAAHAKKTSKDVGSHRDAERPNFIIINLDDMGYGDLTLTGAVGYSTPNLDKMCSEGTLLTHFYAPQAVSSASRAGLLTGCYPNRLGFHGALMPNSNTGLDPEEETIADLLKKKDYATIVVGKWHVGDKEPFMPWNNGFDEYFGLPYSNDMWPPNDRNYKFPPLPLYDTRLENKIRIADVREIDQQMLTTWYTQRAVEFIKENKQKPFFLYLAHSMPHVPLFVSDKFKGKSEQGLYGDVMMELDWSVGEILKTLKDTGLDKNTLVLFTSDNGPWLIFGNHAGSAGGLREGKGCTYEGGQRVPCIAWWPGKVPAGEVNNRLASAIDFLPTFADICNIEPSGSKIDGVSIKEMLFGNKDAKPRKYFLYYYRNNSLEAIRNEEFKLVFPHKGRTYKYVPGNDGKFGHAPEDNPEPLALYDLRRDPGERYNVQMLYPKVMDELMKAAEEARKDLGDDLQNVPGSGRRPIGSIE